MPWDLLELVYFASHLQVNIKHSMFVFPCRLIKHTERLLEEKEEKLCIKVLQTLKEMMTVDIDYGEKVMNSWFRISQFQY